MVNVLQVDFGSNLLRQSMTMFQQPSPKEKGTDVHVCRNPSLDQGSKSESLVLLSAHAASRNAYR